MREIIAVVLYKLGFKHKVSSFLDGTLTRGYGKLHGLGFWEYQIPFKYFNDTKKVK